MTETDFHAPGSGLPHREQVEPERLILHFAVDRRPLVGGDRLLPPQHASFLTALSGWSAISPSWTHQDSARLTQDTAR